MKIEFSEYFERSSKKLSDRILFEVMKKLEEILLSKESIPKLKGKLSKYSCVRIDRDFFVVVKYVPDQKYVVAHALIKRESLYELVRQR